MRGRIRQYMPEYPIYKFSIAYIFFHQVIFIPTAAGVDMQKYKIKMLSMKWRFQDRASFKSFIHFFLLWLNNFNY